MQPSRKQEVWANAAAYEAYVGRWSRMVAREFVDWLAVPAERDWLDVGCGTGALARTILSRAAPRRVHGVDPSPGFLFAAQRNVSAAHTSFAVGDARALPYRPAALDAVTAGLMLNFVPEPRLAVSEMAGVLRPAGLVAAYVWDYTDQMQFMRHFWDAAVALDPGARDLAEDRRFLLCRPDPLAQLFAGAGLDAVEVRAIDIPTVFRDFDDYWNPFLGGQGPAPAYTMSLSEDRRLALRDRLRADLPIGDDGSIPLIARAWAVRGYRGAGG